MKYQKNIKITVSKAEQETIKDILDTLEEMDAGGEMDSFSIWQILDAISDKSEEVDVLGFGDVEIEYEEGTIF